MTITIPYEILFPTRMTEQEMAMELAVVMYERGGMPLESAAEVARMGRRQFAHLLASRDISVDPQHFSADGACPDRERRGTVTVDYAGVLSASEAELLSEIAIVLYEREKLSLGRAAQLARMDRWEFNSLLAERGVPMHYDKLDLEQDLATLRSLRGMRVA